jgi:hypothetical protein
MLQAVRQETHSLLVFVVTWAVALFSSEEDDFLRTLGK